MTFKFFRVNRHHLKGEHFWKNLPIQCRISVFHLQDLKHYIHLSQQYVIYENRLTDFIRRTNPSYLCFHFVFNLHKIQTVSRSSMQSYIIDHICLEILQQVLFFFIRITDIDDKLSRKNWAFSKDSQGTYFTNSYHASNWKIGLQSFIMLTLKNYLQW